MPFAYCLNTKMVRVVNVRSMLYMNNVGKVITEDLGYKLRVGNNTIDFNEDDAMYAFTRTSRQNSSGCLAFKKASQLNFFKKLRFSEVTL